MRANVRVRKVSEKCRAIKISSVNLEGVSCHRKLVLLRFALLSLLWIWLSAEYGVPSKPEG